MRTETVNMISANRSISSRIVTLNNPLIGTETDLLICYI